jgi:hypothetical protein
MKYELWGRWFHGCELYFYEYHFQKIIIGILFSDILKVIFLGSGIIRKNNLGGHEFF